MSEAFCSVMLLFGMAVTAFGVYCLLPAAGLVTAGVMLMLLSFLFYLSRQDGGRDGV